MFINDYYAIDIPFIKLNITDIFYSNKDCDYFMKIYEVESDEGYIIYNAVSLSTGELIYIQDEEPVKKVKGELKIE